MENPTLDLSNYQSQGNVAIDMVANAIIHERKQGVNPDLITLNPPYFAMLKAWVRKNYGARKAKSEFYLDGVKIEMDEWNKKRALLVHYIQKA